MTIVEQRIIAAREGRNEQVIAQMESGWAVLGAWQYFRGYCLLLADPIVPTLNELSPERQQMFLMDMAAIGQAAVAATDAARANYAIFGNTDPLLHAHIHPRHADEPEPQKFRPTWLVPESEQEKFPFDRSMHQPLMDQIRTRLAASKRMVS